MILLLTTALAGWFSDIRYGVGLTATVGVGTHGAPTPGRLVVEPVSFELRSFLVPRFAFHTTLHLTRMALPALLREDGRIDYDLHLGAHLPLRRGPTLVLAPGASLAYSFTGSRYQRFTGNLRLGVDVPHGAWTLGVYLAPFVGHAREAWTRTAGLTAGAALQLSAIWTVPPKR